VPRIYHPSALTLNQEVTLSPRATQHCLKVLRLKSDHEITLFCGDDKCYKAKLLVIDKVAKAVIFNKEDTSKESPLKLHLGQGLARGDRMDWIIQKAVECGVSEITPLIMEKSVIKIKNDRLSNKMEHWQNIIISACEQSGRNTLPTLHSPIKLQEWLAKPFAGATIVFSQLATSSIKSLDIQKSNIRVLLGPESGFSPSEEHLVNKLFLPTCHLGPRILRTETATVAALSALQSHFGDL